MPNNVKLELTSTDGTELSLRRLFNEADTGTLSRRPAVVRLPSHEDITIMNSNFQILRYKQELPGAKNLLVTTSHTFVVPVYIVLMATLGTYFIIAPSLHLSPRKIRVGPKYAFIV